MMELTFQIPANVGPWSQIAAAKLAFGQAQPGQALPWGQLVYGGDTLAEAGLSTPIRTVTTTSSIGAGSTFSDQDINGILSGYAWSSSTLTYSFPLSPSNYGTGYGTGPGEYPDPAPFNGFTPMTWYHEDLIRSVLGLISQYTGLTFTRITETDQVHADLRFAGSTSPMSTYAFGPAPGVGGNGDATSGDVFFGSIRSAYWLKGGYAYETVLREIAHVLGLKPGYDSTPVFGALPAPHDSNEWSLMSLYSYLDSNKHGITNVEGSANQSYMANDIAALQHLYGANFNANATDTTYTFNPANGEMFINGVGQGASTANKAYGSIWDGGGVDTYDFSNYATHQLIDLRPGEWTIFSAVQLADLDATNPGVELAHGNILNAHLYNNNPASLIENAVAGPGNDLIFGNPGRNTLSGGVGGDIIFGGAGADSLSGGSGSDWLGSGAVGVLTASSLSFFLQDGGDDVIDGGSGVDLALLVFAGRATPLTFTLADPALVSVISDNGAAAGSVTGVEAIWFWGGDGADAITGASNSDELTGFSGDDTLNGVGGDDALSGGLGNDRLAGGDGNDTLDGGQGTDTAAFTGVHAGAWVHAYAVGGTIYTDVLDQAGAQGRDTLAGVETLSFGGVNFALAGVQQNHLANVDGGRFDDVLIRSASTGQIGFIDMIGQAAGAQGVIRAVTGALPAGWTAAASGDLDGDGRAEAIVQGPTGGLFYINTASGSPVWGAISAGLPSEWRVVGLGDMTLDGALDVVIRSSVSGNIMYAEMDGSAFSGWGNVFNMGTGWRAAGIGDYDRDGDSDVLVQETATGTTYFVQMQNGAFSGWGLVTGGPGGQWVAKETADLNGDGYFDVVFQNSSTSQVWAVNMAGGVNSGWITLTTAVGWDVVGSGDYDNDGYADILVQSPHSGDLFYINVDNGVMAGWGNVRNGIGTDWVAV